MVIPSSIDGDFFYSALIGPEQYDFGKTTDFKSECLKQIGETAAELIDRAKMIALPP